jgi:osmotically-inducible protein OsmY
MTADRSYEATVTGALEDGATVVPPRTPSARDDASMYGGAPGAATDLGGAEYGLSGRTLGTPSGFVANEAHAADETWRLTHNLDENAEHGHRAGKRERSSGSSATADAIALLGGIGIGAAVMYFMDPDRGRRRRALVRDKAQHFASRVPEAVGTTQRDLANRARGLAAQARGRFADEGATNDDVIVARVRSALGRVCSHPGSVVVTSDGGRVTVSGPVLASEAQAVISAVGRARGVREVISQLEVHEEADSFAVPGLQGGRDRSGARFELLQENWTPAARLITTVAGSTLAAWAASRRGVLGTAIGLFGLGLAVRGSTNRAVMTPLQQKARGLTDRAKEIVPTKLADVASDLPDRAMELAADAGEHLKVGLGVVAEHARDVADRAGGALGEIGAELPDMVKQKLPVHRADATSSGMRAEAGGAYEGSEGLDDAPLDRDAANPTPPAGDPGRRPGW